jgi:histidine triad (HIT) family protein
MPPYCIICIKGKLRTLIYITEAGQEVFHTHLHSIPRFKDDGFGLKFPKNYWELPERSELESIASEIKRLM